MRARLVPILVGVNLAALAFSLWMVRLALSVPLFPVAEQPGPDGSFARVNDLGHLSNEVLLSQPLFTASRTAQSHPAEVSAAPPLLAPPRLVGIVRTETNTRRVLLETVSGDSQRLMETGESIDGWTVTRIDRDSAILTRPRAMEASRTETDLSLRLHPPPNPLATINE